MTTVRLVFGCSSSGALVHVDKSVGIPAGLVSYHYKHGVKEMVPGAVRDWALDSGAYSAYASGIKIDLAAYMEFAKKCLIQNALLTEVFSLDVILDWKAGLRNTEKMWESGIRAIPTYHYGEPVEVLDIIARDYPKIAIGGCARMNVKKKQAFAKYVFGRVWPKPIHGFGFGDEKTLTSVPFHSADASSWEMGPYCFGRIKGFGGKTGLRGGRYNLTLQVNYFLRVEQRVKSRWKREMKILDAQLEEANER